MNSHQTHLVDDTVSIVVDTVECRERGTILVVVAAVMATSVLLAGTALSMMHAKVKTSAEFEQSIEANYLAEAAASQAFAEVTSQADTTGSGLGAMGIGNPMIYVDSAGNIVGEYKTFVRQEGAINIIVALAAIPSFEDPETTVVTERVIKAGTEFLLAPKPAALSIAGPLANPEFDYARSSTMNLDGGTAPALVLTSYEAWENVMQELGDMIANGSIAEDDIIGSSAIAFEHDRAGTIELPIIHQEGSFITSETMDNYRNSLRTAVEAMSDRADLVFDSSRITGDHTWGTEADPKIVVVDTNGIGSTSRCFNTRGQTVTGHGTLIIKHTFRPKKDLNLNWTGDVYVLGYDADNSSDLMYPKGIRATINGNLILLASNHTEASLEIANSRRRNSQLTVNGSLLVLAEASSHEAEVEVEDTSILTVNGMLGAFGSRIELESGDPGTTFNVNGTVAVGMAQELGDFYRYDDFEFEMRGATNIIYNRALVEAAVEGLTNLEADLSMDGAEIPSSYNFSVAGGAGTMTTEEALALLAEMEATGGEMGVVLANGPGA